MRWDIKPQSLGGLGIQGVIDKNHALLAKWIWRYIHEEDAFWRKLFMQNVGLTIISHGQTSFFPEYIKRPRST